MNQRKRRWRHERVRYGLSNDEEEAKKQIETNVNSCYDAVQSQKDDNLHR